MTNYQFAGSLYRTEIDMLDALAHDWVTSCGNATFKDVVSILRNNSDDDLTVEVVTELGLNEPTDPDDPDSPSHMARHGYEATDLEQAFARFRADIEHDLDVEARGDGEMHEP